MDKDNQFSEEQLNAFVDGELDADEKSRVFNESQQSQELDQRLCQQRKLKELVKHAYADVPAAMQRQDLRKLQRGFWRNAMAASILLLLGVTIGFYAHSGTAFNNRRDAYVVETPEPGTLESVLAMAGLKTSYFNLRNATHPWARSETVARYNGLNDQLLRPADQYDAILFMAEVTPPEFLY